MQAEDVVKQIYEKLNEEFKKMGHVNIVISGKTGVGKSTLVNAVFGKKIAETGTGRPITQEIKEITTTDYPLRLYDTVGLELSDERQEKVKNDIIKLIKDARISNDSDKLIHCIWYCINANSNRIEDEEVKFIEKLSTESDVPVIIILTQSYGLNAKDLQKYIDNMNLHIKRCFCVLACDYQVDEEYCKKAYGCDKLVEYVIEILPETAQKAFINAQCASLKAKREKSQFIVVTTVAAAFGEGFIPLPFADAAALVPTQIAMIASITATYGINIKKSAMTAIITSLLGSTGLTIAGKTIVANLIKIIPGVGTGVGGAISGGTAAVLTGALGETYILIMDMIIKGEITEKQLENEGAIDQFKKIFKDKLKHPKIYTN